VPLWLLVRMLLQYGGSRGVPDSRRRSARHLDAEPVVIAREHLWVLRVHGFVGPDRALHQKQREDQPQNRQKQPQNDSLTQDRAAPHKCGGQ